MAAQPSIATSQEAARLPDNQVPPPGWAPKNPKRIIETESHDTVESLSELLGVKVVSPREQPLPELTAYAGRPGDAPPIGAIGRLAAFMEQTPDDPAHKVVFGAKWLETDSPSTRAKRNDIEALRSHKHAVQRAQYETVRQAIAAQGVQFYEQLMADKRLALVRTAQEYQTKSQEIDAWAAAEHQKLDEPAPEPAPVHDLGGPFEIEIPGSAELAARKEASQSDFDAAWADARRVRDALVKRELDREPPVAGDSAPTLHTSSLATPLDGTASTYQVGHGRASPYGHPDWTRYQSDKARFEWTTVIAWIASAGLIASIGWPLVRWMVARS